jgi:hypothetical protein
MSLIRPERFMRQCESPACSRRRRLWRTWLEPVRGLSLDGHWYCSPACFEQALAFAIGQVLPGTAPPPVTTHRVPLGLLMLSRGFVDNAQLKRALKAQKDSGSGRVGEWLRHIGAVSEEQVTQMLGLQWSIPVFPLSQSRRYLECAHLVPHPLLEAAEMVPVHYLPNSQVLYVAFVDRVNYSALYALEKMLDCHTEPCLALQSQLLQALKELGNRHQPVDILADNVSDPWEIANAISAHAAKLGCVDVRVSGFCGFVWARALTPSGHTDVLVHAQGNRPDILFPMEVSS